MSATAPTVLALDFDGVICDGLKEYFQTAWRAYCNLWQPQDTTPPAGTAEIFYRLRPVVETGWEMPLVIRAMLSGREESDILLNWQTIAPQLAQQEGFDAVKLGAEVDGVRDRWIAADLENWLAEHQFYSGVIERLRSILISSIHPIIISTKESRFIQELLQRQGLELANLRIYGKEVKQPKHQVLRELIAEYGDTEVFWFVEDRLKTLQNIQQQTDLQDVKLFLADWGYNTQNDRDLAANDPGIHLMSLAQFGQSFGSWLG